MSTEIARTQDSLDEVVNWSTNMSHGDLLPRQYQNKPANLMFAAEYADSLGISRIHVLTSIAIINGRPSPSADLMSAMVRTHGHKLRVVGDDTYAEAHLIRSDDPDFTYTARWDEAKARKAGLWGNKGPWTNYPAAMLRARAISEVIRMGATDVMAGGVYTPEELGASVDGEGNVIEQQARRQAAPAPTPTPAPHQQAARSDSAADRLAQQLGAAPVDTHSVDEWLDLITGATTEAELTALYETARTNAAWETDIKPMFSTRKTQIQAEATEQAPVEDTEIHEAELMDSAS